MDETFKKLLCVYNFYKTFMWIKLDFRFTSRKAWRQKHHLLPFWLLKRTKMLFERYLVTLVTFPKMKLTAASCSIGQLVQLLKPSFLNWKCEILSRNSTADLDILAYPCSHLGDTKTCNTVNCRMPIYENYLRQNIQDPGSQSAEMTKLLKSNSV